MTKDYDAVIIGGGGGLKIARPAANLGYRIAVIERGPLGGTCLNRGCIPSKMLIHPADIIQQVKEASNVQVHLKGEINVHFKELVHRVNQTIENESKSIEPLLEEHPNIDFYPNTTRFTGPDTLEVSGTSIRGKKIFIATGGRPHIPKIKGLEGTPFMTSTELLKCDNLPKKIIILGAGYTACELGHYLDAMGVEVHFIVRSRFLRHLDTDLQEAFEKAFCKRFKVSKGEPTEVEYKNGEFTVRLKNESLKAGALLVVSGIVPNTDHLNLEATKVALNERGFIEVNPHLETTQKNVYAFGDVIGRYLFRHSANFEGEYLLHEQFEKPKSNKPIDYPPIPYGVFTWPQIAGVGKIERDLQEEKADYLVGLNHYEESAMGMALQTDVGFVKLLFDRKNLKLIGAHCIGEQATTLIHVLIAYMNCKATLDQILSTVYIHPALPEVIRNAARKVRKQLNEESS